MDSEDQMDLFESLPDRADQRDGWIQADLFFAAAEDARERRLKMLARPRSSRIYRQAPLLAAVTIACGIADCRRRFTGAGPRAGHLARAHPKPSAAKPAPRMSPAPGSIVLEDEDAIRTRIRDRMAAAALKAGDRRREGEVA